MLVRILQPQCYGVCRCVAHGLCVSRFHSTRRKVRHHVTWCLAKTSYSCPTWRWDEAVGHCSDGAPLTPPETQKLAAWEPSVHWAKHFVHRIARIWTRLNLQSGVLFSRRSAIMIIKVSPQCWQNEESDCQKHNYRMVQLLPIHQFYQIFIYG